MRSPRIQRQFGTSSVIFRLINGTKNEEIYWVSFIEIQNDERITEFFVQYMSSYFSKLKQVRFIAEIESVFFAVNDNRLFAISRSKYSRQLRLDFCRINRNNEIVWYRVASKDDVLSRLYILIDIVGKDTKNEFMQIVSANYQ